MEEVTRYEVLMWASAEHVHWEPITSCHQRHRLQCQPLACWKGVWLDARIVMARALLATASAMEHGLMTTHKLLQLICPTIARHAELTLPLHPSRYTGGASTANANYKSAFESVYTYTYMLYAHTRLRRKENTYKHQHTKTEEHTCDERDLHKLLLRSYVLEAPCLQ